MAIPILRCWMLGAGKFWATSPAPCIVRSTVRYRTRDRDSATYSLPPSFSDGMVWHLRLHELLHLHPLVDLFQKPHLLFSFPTSAFSRALLANSDVRETLAGGSGLTPDIDRPGSSSLPRDPHSIHRVVNHSGRKLVFWAPVTIRRHRQSV